MKQEGKLNPEQFCLAMWLIAQKQSGKDPPASLTPDMVPPSMRTAGQEVSISHFHVASWCMCTSILIFPGHQKHLQQS